MDNDKRNVHLKRAQSASKHRIIQWLRLQSTTKITEFQLPRPQNKQWSQSIILIIISKT